MELNTKLYAGYAEQIERIKEKQKEIGDEILAELEELRTKKLAVEELGTFSITERGVWKYRQGILDAGDAFRKVKRNYELSHEPDKISKYLRFQRTALDKKGECVKT